MDAMQNDYDVFRRGVYRVAVSKEFEHNRRIVKSIGDNDDDDEDFDDLEALRLAALRSLGTKNPYEKRGSASADVGDTRRVSLGHEEECDLQIVAHERQNSFASSSTDYEDIALSEKSYPGSGENYSDLDLDNPESEDDFQSDSLRDDQEMDEKEYSDVGQSEDDAKNDDDVKNDIVLTDDYDAENNVLTDEKDVDDNDIFTDEDDMQREEVDRDSDENSENESEVLEDELLGSGNEISISNDISITIANESLVANSDEHLEIVDDEIENNSELNQEHESDSESLNENQLTTSQRIIVSQSDNEVKNDSHIETTTQVLDKKCTSGSQVIEDKGNRRESSVVSSVMTNSSEKVKTEVSPASEGKPKNISKIGKGTDIQKVTVKSGTAQGGAKSTSKLPTKQKPEITITSNIKNNKVVLSKEKVQEKEKETMNDEGEKQNCDKNVPVKAVSHESKAKASSEEGVKLLVTDLESVTENEEKMDFDQLSIEDEDSDFDVEENLPAVKSKVGLNKIPTEHPRRKRSNSRESNRKRHSYSLEKSRTSSRSHHSQSLSRDRLRDQRLHDRSRERYNHRRSHSPSTDRRTHSRKNYSHRHRSRSRDRTQERITRDRENRHYRSRSRSDSRTRSGRTKKLVESNVDKQIKKESGERGVKRHLESGDKVNTTHSSRSQRKEMRAQEKSNKEETVKVKEVNSTTVKLIANGTKKVSKPTVQRDVDGFIIKQPKDLRSRLSEKKAAQKKATQTEVLDKKKSKTEVTTKFSKERELDARIQQIKKKNEVIVKRAKEIQAEKRKFSS